MTVIRVVVHGAEGRMGTRICERARRDARFDLVSLDAMNSCDVIIDFSSSEGAAQAAQLAARHSAAIVVGTTGLSAKTARVLDEIADSVPLLVAPNTSLGMAVAMRLAVSAARALGPTWRVEIEERHHAAKRDAPSGTALRIAEVLAAEAGRRVDPAVRGNRAGGVTDRVPLPEDRPSSGTQGGVRSPRLTASADCLWHGGFAASLGTQERVGVRRIHPVGSDPAQADRHEPGRQRH